MTEVLAPAGDEACLKAAAASGADAVYFGLPQFNARARAANFDEGSIDANVRFLHRAGVKAYVTLNTLVFDRELDAVAGAIRTAANAGVDALIVQDWAVARLVAEIAPSLRVHASTQMTCTDAASVNFAGSLGAKRVVLARELSLEEIQTIARATDIELEVFVHGALCVAYSGQCLTSEAIGGRSANRGACAQSCRLPYDLIVDGVVRELGDRAYLLSPEDLEASAMVPALVFAGVSSLKIEGRLKGPEYVAATTRLYRHAVDAAHDAHDTEIDHLRRAALQMYSRGSGPGFLKGVDHQRLVEARHCDHVGVQIGQVVALEYARGRALATVTLSEAVARGDGVLIEGGKAGVGELGGRVWDVLRNAQPVDSAATGERVQLWFGPDHEAMKRAVAESAEYKGRRLYRNDSPTDERAARVAIERSPYRVSLDVVASGQDGEPMRLVAKSDRGHRAEVVTDVALACAEKSPISAEAVREKLEKLSDTPFVLGEFRFEVDDGLIVPISSINRARRALAFALETSIHRTHPVVETSISGTVPKVDQKSLAGGLFVLCRTVEQARAARDAGADGVILDFLELTGTGAALRALRSEGPVQIGVAPPRIRKPGEEKIERYLIDLAPDLILVRSLGALAEVPAQFGGHTVGDFSLNLTNRYSATEALSRGLSAFTPSFDLDAEQLLHLVDDGLGPHCEVVVHHPMPLFHMEHCVFAALLSEGRDHRSCGRPCDRHEVKVRDRAGFEHPLEADVSCRNTVFHARSQSAAEWIAPLRARGVRRFRIELVRESADQVGRLVAGYRSLIDGTGDHVQVVGNLRVEQGYGVVRGSLRVLA
jgi:putative protease